MIHRNRKNIRLQGYDYSSEGNYFITICTRNRECFFGNIEDKKFEYSSVGAIAYTFWNEIPKHFTQVQLGEFTIMPNHIHGIIKIVGSPDVVGSRHGVNLRHGANLRHANKNEFGKTIPGSVSTIIGQYKSSVTRWCNKNDFNFSWQSRFHDHIIRDDAELDRIERYIVNNVDNWADDKLFI